MLQTQSNQMAILLEGQGEIKEKQKFYFNELDGRLIQHGDILKTIPEFQEQNIEINSTIAQALMGISQMTVNQGQIFDQALGQTKEEIIETQKEDTDLLMNEVQNQNQKLDTIQEKISQMSDRIDVLRQVFETQFEKARRNYKDNLLTVLNMVAKLPHRTSNEIIETLKEELDVSKTTMYKYFRKLQEKDLIRAQKLKNGKRGRPPRAFSITDKLKNLIQKITKN
jgi:DNA-binding transcriptional regulator GbsR (MarR family)